MSNRFSIIGFSVIFGFLLLWNGCAPVSRCYGPVFSPLDDSLESLGILEPEIFTYDISAGGIYEYRCDWSTGAQQKITQSLKDLFAKQNINTVLLPDSTSSDRYNGLKTRFRYHCSTIQSALYGENCLSVQIDSFTYSLDHLDSLCDRFGVNGLVYIYGFEENFSKERVKLLTTSARAKTSRSLFFGVLLGIFTGYYGYTSYSVPPERTFLAIMIAERNGRIRWYKHAFNAENLNLNDKADAYKAVQAVCNGIQKQR